MRNFILFLLLAVGLPLSAQVYPGQSAIWHSQQITLLGPNPYWELSCGDTLIGGKTYQRIYQYYPVFEGDGYTGGYFGAVRQEGDTVWAVQAEQDTEYLLYDYSLEEGDTINLPFYWGDSTTLTVDSTWTTEIAGETRKALRLIHPFVYSETWVEGLGSSFGLFGRGFIAIDAASQLFCFSLEGEVLYKAFPDVECEFPFACEITTSADDLSPELPVRLFPNPSAGRLWLQLPESGSAYRLDLFSPAGQLVWRRILPGGNHELDLSRLPEGCYWLRIQGERKVAVRKVVLGGGG